MVLGNVLDALRSLGYRSDDDRVDRLHYFVTSNILIGFAILVSWKQFGGQPMECLVPTKFSGAWEQYTENYCWSQDTYFLPPDEIPQWKTSFYGDREGARPLSYYQWVPFYLLLVAACFRAPSLLWKHLSEHSGIKIHQICMMASDRSNLKKEIKQESLKTLTTHLQGALKFHRRLLRKNLKPHKVLCFLNLPYSASFITVVYLVSKLLYLFNVFLQMYLMNKFLETDRYSWYGFGVVKDLLNGTQWQQTGIFPRVTLCDLEVRGDPANIQQYTIQCVLVINIFNEKIFFFLWFWFLFLAVVTAASFCYWFWVMLFPWANIWFISRHLELSEMPFDPHGSRKDVERFVNRYLKSDGAFVIRMITLHSGIIFGTDLVLSMWRSFYGIEQQLKADTPVTPPQLLDENNDNRLNVLRLRKPKKDAEKDDGKDELIEKLIPPNVAAKPTAPPLRKDSNENHHPARSPGTRSDNNDDDDDDNGLAGGPSDL